MGRSYCLYGAGGHARELAAQIEMEYGSGSVVCFVDDTRPAGEIDGIPVVAFDLAIRRYKAAQWLAAIGNPSDRRRLSDRIVDGGGVEGRFASARAYLSSSSSLSAGTQVFAGACVSNDVRLGRGVIINFNSTVSHECQLGDFVTLSPGCTVAGRVRIGAGSFLGAGATVINGAPGGWLDIGARATIAAGAVVTGPVQDGTTVAGVPARVIVTASASC